MIDPAEFFLNRRSVKTVDMVPGAPSPADRDTILAAGLRVPDHGKLAPFKFVVFAGEARLKFGQEVLAPRFAALNPEAAPTSVALEGQRLTQAGLVIAVLSTPRAARIPVWEQHLAAGAAAMNLLLCAQALGYGAQWLTQWYSFDMAVLAALGGDPAAGDQVAGFIYIGGKQTNPEDRDRPDPKAHIKFWP